MACPKAVLTSLKHLIINNIYYTMKNMKKCSKVSLSLLLAVGMMVASVGFVSCGSSHETMYPTKKYKNSKPVKSNITVRGTNSKNGSTYRSY